jgi:type I restriction enzyme S subunit
MVGNGARTNVGDYVTLVRGTTYKGSLVGEAGPALLGLGSIEPGGGFRSDNYKTYGGDCPAGLMLSPNDIYASLKGATKDGKMIGSVARVPASVPLGRLTQDTVKLVFRSPDPNDCSYLYWVLRSPQYRAYCAGHATGSAVVALSRHDFLSYPVPPPTTLRRIIVTLLDKTEEKIELNRKMNAALESISRALFKSWFVNFDLVRAKSEKKRLALPRDLAEALPSSFEQSEVGEIPMGWEVTPISEIATIEKGISYKGDFLSDDGLPMINLGCFLGSGEFDFERAKGYAGDYGERHLVHRGDIVIANTDITQKRTVLGSPGIVDIIGPFEQALFSHHTYAVRLHEGEESMRYFLYHLLRQDSFRARAAGFATGTTVLALPRDAVETFAFARPPSAFITAFNSVVEPMMARQRIAKRESHYLRLLRDKLLPKLITGELRDSDTEPILQESA